MRLDRVVESACIPVPSEVIQLFAGYLVSLDRMGLVAAIAAGLTAEGRGITNRMLGNVMKGALAEGVSHFVYVAFRSERGREVSELELEVQAELWRSPLAQLWPRGPVHNDLFRDNAMFVGDTISGVFDFYFAGVEAWLFDLCVCLNDWCIDRATGELQPEKAQALQSAYEAVRPLTPSERAAMPRMLRAAALRFWLSRLADWHAPREAHVLQPHDPGHFERVLRARREGR